MEAESAHNQLCKLESQQSLWYNWVSLWGEWISVQGQERMRFDVFAQGWDRRRGQMLPSSAFRSTQALKGLEESLPQRVGQSSFLSLQIQTLISSTDTLMDTPRNTSESGHLIASRADIKFTIISSCFPFLLFLKSQETSSIKYFLSTGFFSFCSGAASKSVS